MIRTSANARSRVIEIVLFSAFAPAVAFITPFASPDLIPLP